MGTFFSVCNGLRLGSLKVASTDWNIAPVQKNPHLRNISRPPADVQDGQMSCPGLHGLRLWRGNVRIANIANID